MIRTPSNPMTQAMTATNKRNKDKSNLDNTLNIFVEEMITWNSLMLVFVPWSLLRLLCEGLESTVERINPSD